MENKNIKISDVASFLTKTGFILEMETAEILKKYGYEPKVNQFFLDLEENKKREIDIVATKKINNIFVHLIIECKQSFYDSWVFICSDKKPNRYYYAIKHTPSISNLHKTKLFNFFHYLDSNKPLAQNYISFDKEKGKKSKNYQIEECLFKLPKALFHIASKTKNEGKNIFLPITLFDRQIFTASYDKKILVKEEDLIQFYTNYESEYYREKEDESEHLPPFGRTSTKRVSILDYPFGKRETEKEKIIEMATLLGSHFQIDFITKKGLNKYLKIIDEEVKKISVKKWSFNSKR